MVKRRFGRRARQLGSGIVSAVMKAFTNPLANIICIIGIAIGVYYFGNTDKLKLILDSLSKQIPVLKPVSDYCSKNLTQTAGFIIVGPAVFSSTSAGAALGYLALSALAVFKFLSPAKKVSEYVCLALCGSAFLSTKSRKVQLIVICVILYTIASGMWGDELFVMK